MIGSMIKFIIRTAVYMTFWVFILSLQWEGKTLFERARQTLVLNPLVDLVDTELSDKWAEIREALRLTFKSWGEAEEKST